LHCSLDNRLFCRSGDDLEGRSGVRWWRGTTSRRSGWGGEGHPCVAVRGGEGRGLGPVDGGGTTGKLFDSSHDKDALMPGKGFAVRGRMATPARQRFRRQREHCRRMANSHGKGRCRACAGLPCGRCFAVCRFFAVRGYFAVRRDSTVRPTVPC
jgi:hypothetical protein